MTPPDWQRPEFEPGNDLAVKSGAWSPARVEPKAEALLAGTLADPALAYLTAPSYAPVLRHWATVQTRSELFGEWLFAKPMDEQITPPRGGAKSPLDVWLGMVRTATALADKLGLTPLSRARLGRDLAVTGAVDSRMTDLSERGAALVAEARRVGVLETPTDDEDTADDQHG